VAQSDKRYGEIYRKIWPIPKNKKLYGGPCKKTDVLENLWTYLMVWECIKYLVY